MEDNRKAAIAWSAVEILFWLACLVMSINDPNFVPGRVVYAIALLAAIATLVCSIRFAGRGPQFAKLLVYAMQLVLLVTGIGLAYLQPDVRPVTIIAAVLVVPVMFVSDTLPVALFEAACIVVFAVTGPNFINPEVQSWTLKMLVMFSIVGILMGYFINKARFERYSYEESALELAELRNKYAYYDQLTGLQNRRAYAERVEELAANPPADCCVIVVDVNGLKRINDTYGHSAGDGQIIGAAKCLNRCFKDVGDVYRLGGDEFCVIATLPESAAWERLLDAEQMAAGWTGQSVESISLSYGMATTRDNPNIEAALKAADQNMYEFKRRYYTTSGRERRRR